MQPEEEVTPQRRSQEQGIHPKRKKSTAEAFVREDGSLGRCQQFSVAGLRVEHKGQETNQENMGMYTRAGSQTL